MKKDAINMKIYIELGDVNQQYCKWNRNVGLLVLIWLAYYWRFILYLQIPYLKIIVGKVEVKDEHL